MTADETYMHRCIQLAKLANGYTAPNPMVGAVLVYHGRIIGEGYHRQYGEAHAEVNCFLSVLDEDQHLVSESTLYVSLEPCAHFGKTPPCADLCIAKGVKKVVVGCRDPFTQVNGKGIEKLQAARIEVEVGVLERDCIALNRRFFTFHTERRPYIILKWAQTANGKIAHSDYSRVLISNAYTNRLVHKWRSEEAAILVGTNTALYDNPELTTRQWPGMNPVRLVIDKDLRLSPSGKLFDRSAPTVVFNVQRHTLPFEKVSRKQLQEMGTGYYQVTEDSSLVHQVLNALTRMNLLSVMVEGGAYLLQSFVDEGLWDEARVITNEELVVENGLPAPVLKNHCLSDSITIGTDTIRTYEHHQQ